jgi:microcystin-dependent protein
MDSFLGEIRIFSGSYAPLGWAFCNGQLLQVQQQAALYSLLGTIYGGDGRTTFAVPDMRARAPINQGTGPGLTPRAMGDAEGSATVSLTSAELPSHAHSVVCGGNATQVEAEGNVWATTGRGVVAPYAQSINALMLPTTAQAAGGSLPHDNQQPYLVLNFIISLEGEYPQRP